MRLFRALAPGLGLLCCASALHGAPGDPASGTNAVQVVLDGFPADRTFSAEALELPVRLLNRTAHPLVCRVQVDLIDYRPNETHAPLASTAREIEIPPGSPAEAPARFTPPASGPYTFRVSVVMNQETQACSGTLLYRPAAWTLPDLEPVDFDAFWKRTLDELRARPLEPRFSEPADPRLAPPRPFREVSFNGLGTNRIHGYLGLPPGSKPEHRLPVVLSLPSAGYHCAAAETGLVQQGYIVLAISIHDLPFGGDSYRTHPRDRWFTEPYQGMGRESRETFYYRAAYAAGPRAVDFLRSLPEVDPQRIIVSGFSQGGSLTLATAGLVPDVALAEAGGAGRSRMDLLTFTYKANMSLTPPAGMTAQEMLSKTLLYYDVSYFARRVRCPVLMRVSLDDETNPGPLQVWAFSQLAHSPDARLQIAPGLKHAMPPDTNGVVRAMRQRYAPAAAGAPNPEAKQTGES